MERIPSICVNIDAVSGRKFTLENFVDIGVEATGNQNLDPRHSSRKIQESMKNMAFIGSLVSVAVISAFVDRINENNVNSWLSDSWWEDQSKKIPKSSSLCFFFTPPVRMQGPAGPLRISRMIPQ